MGGGKAIGGAGVAGILAAWALQAGAALPPGVAAEVLDLTGTGEQRPTAQAPWAPARQRQDLAGGAFVRTGGASKMALLFADETQVRLNQNSMLQVKEIAANGRSTTLRLEFGRAWSQTRNAPDGLRFETPSATAAIRGTDWELDVDAKGTSTLTVLSGSVEFFNDQGRVVVERDEAAIAEVGKAPVKIVLTRPRDRVQWVNAFAFEPRRFDDAAARVPALKAAVDAIAAGDAARGRTLLDAERARGTREAAVFGALADLELVTGDLDAALAAVRAGLAIAPGDPELIAREVRIELLADRVDAARAALARPRDAETAGVLVAAGEEARRDGRTAEALEAFSRAVRVAPGDDRGPFALGRLQTEREDTRPARRNLERALALNPAGPGYEGELGTLETFANRFGAADAAFGRALAAQPGDYVALTGLGLLRLKEGKPAEALDALLRAGVMEPRFARAKTYTGVAYWQLGRRDVAIATLREAAALDDKDPLPWILLTQVYTDLFRAGDAVAASREALARLPFLKSANQVANNQQGTANLGYSLAFFGLEDWALELAQQSYDPYAAASHLFLADRYSGDFNKNSELFQGFLTDPTAFGGSNRFSTLVQSRGNYGTIGNTYNRSPDDRLWNPYFRVNGIVDGLARTAYFADAEYGNGIVREVSTDTDGNTGKVKGDERVELYAAGVGSLLTEDLGLFAYATKIRDVVRLRDFSGTEGDQDKQRADIGLRYRFSPTSMTWLKVGQTSEHKRFRDYILFNPDLTAAVGASSTFASRPTDYQFRHTMDVTPADRIAFGYEYARDKRTAEFFAGTVLQTPDGFISFGQLDSQEGKFVSKQGYASWIHEFGPKLSAQADVYWQQFRQTIEDFTATLLIIGDQRFPTTNLLQGSAVDTKWNPRFGVVWKPDNLVIRAAYQEWIQPASVSTLAPVATAGIPLDDRLVATGGQAKRAAFRAHWEPDSRTAVSFAYDWEKIRNLGRVGFRIPTPQIEFVDLLRNAQLFNVASADLLEGVPDFDAGRVQSLGATIGRIVTPQFSLAARYVYSKNRAEYFQRDETGTIVSVTGDARIPYVPRDLFVVGATWVSPLRVYLSAQAVYRSTRFTDRDNTESGRIPADWNGQVVGFWESPDKRWILGLAALNLGAKGARERYVADVRFRF